MSTPLASPSLQDLLQQVRFLLKQPDPNNSNWSDQELLAFINEGIRVHFVELTAIDEGHFTTTAKLSVVAGQEEVELPADFFKVKTLHKVSGDSSIILQYRNSLTDSFSASSNGSATSYFPNYFFRGNKLVLRPAPDFSETDSLLLEYIQFPETLLNGTDKLTAQISPVFRQVIEAYAVYMAKFTESLVSGTNTFALAEGRLASLITQFKEMNAIRSKSPTFVKPWNPGE